MVYIVSSSTYDRDYFNLLYFAVTISGDGAEISLVMFDVF